MGYMMKPTNQTTCLHNNIVSCDYVVEYRVSTESRLLSASVYVIRTQVHLKTKS